MNGVREEEEEEEEEEEKKCRLNSLSALTPPCATT